MWRISIPPSYSPWIDAITDVILLSSQQTQADLIGMPVNRPQMRETTAFGAAIAAGMASGVWKTFEDLSEVNTEGRTLFKPQISPEESSKRFARWEKAVEMSRGWMA